jgi:hypothetical protein
MRADARIGFFDRVGQFFAGGMIRKNRFDRQSHAEKLRSNLSATIPVRSPLCKSQAIGGSVDLLPRTAPRRVAIVKLFAHDSGKGRREVEQSTNSAKIVPHAHPSAGERPRDLRPHKSRQMVRSPPDVPVQQSAAARSLSSYRTENRHAKLVYEHA